MNNCEVSPHCPYDYLFTMSGSITGWATWKRVMDEWNEYIDFVDDEYTVEIFKKIYNNRINPKKFVKKCKRRNASGIAYYETIMDGFALPQSRLNIVPTKNMICNIGNDGESTHGAADIKLLPKGIRRIFNMKTYEYEFPLNHPPYVIEDLVFLKEIQRIMAVGHPFVKLYRKIESIIYRIASGDFSMFNRILKRIFKNNKG